MSEADESCLVPVAPKDAPVRTALQCTEPSSALKLVYGERARKPQSLSTLPRTQNSVKLIPGELRQASEGPYTLRAQRDQYHLP